jgi:hypothetical protein
VSRTRSRGDGMESVTGGSVLGEAGTGRRVGPVAPSASASDEGPAAAHDPGRGRCGVECRHGALLSGGRVSAGPPHGSAWSAATQLRSPNAGRLCPSREDAEAVLRWARAAGGRRWARHLPC